MRKPLIAVLAASVMLLAACAGPKTEPVADATRALPAGSSTSTASSPKNASGAIPVSTEANAASSATPQPARVAPTVANSARAPDSPPGSGQTQSERSRSAAQSTGIPGRTKPAPPMSTQLPPERVPDTGAPPRLNTSCRTSSDCAVKNVGNCCGAMPACVNRNSAVNPEAVKAQCARNGLMSTCGFKDVQSCSCVAGTCQDNSAGAPEAQ